MYTKWPLVGQAGGGHFMLEIVVRNGLLALVIYLNLNLLIPHFARPQRWVRYGVLLLLSITGYVVLKNTHDIYLQRAIGTLPQQGFFSPTFYNLSIAVFYVSFSIALQLSREWFMQREVLRQIAFEKVNTELEYLKAQINPHFLFNSINTIYFQIDKENRMAREMLSSFSDMLRYQLYECNGTSISVEKEVAYLRSYVDLQRIRKDEHYNIRFSAGEDVRGFDIAPLLLIPFVENAFKHVSHFHESNDIDIALSQSGGMFSMTVINTRDGTVSARGQGIGLRNVKRRLELVYNGRHTLSIEEGPSDFRVYLNINIVSKKNAVS
jgi:LytS/YehU family sensor histidine kinase